MMDGFTADFLTNLTAELSAPVIAKAARRFRDAWQGDEAERALARCVQAGVVGMVSKASLDEPDQAALLADIFTDFCRSDDVVKEVAQLLRKPRLDVGELIYLFGEAGYDAETLPGLRLEEAMAAFEAAFLETAVNQPPLQPIMHLHQSWAQTELQRQMVALMRQMVAALQGQSGQVGIQAGSITAENVVSGTQIIYQWPTEALPDKTGLNAYLRWLMGERQTLSLRAIASGKMGGTGRAPELTQVYVALNTKEAVEGRQRQKPLSVLSALVRRQRIVLLGDPGGGKSTFVSHLAYCLAAHALYPASGWLSHLKEWPKAQADQLPLLLILRDFARWLPHPLPPKAHPHHLSDFIAEMLQKEKLEGVLPLLEKALDEGNVLLLLDGLDEVTTIPQRHFVRDAVQAFGKRYANCPLLVTCRARSYQPPDEEKEEAELRLPLDAYPTFELAPFDQAQQDAFVAGWYKELKRLGHLPGLDEGRLSRDLQRAIRRSDLQRVAGNPLLLTVMAMVHAEEGRLPDARALLYNKTIDLLLARWEELKDVEGVPQLRQMLQAANRTEGDLKTRLAAVAFAVHTGSGTVAEDERVSDVGEGVLCQALSHLHKKDLGWAQRLLTIIKTRAGLLVERSPGQFAFPHRTFQEYLAGVHLASGTDFIDEASQWGQRDVGWWPMVLFAVEHLVYVNERPLDPLPLISQLCPQEAPETVEDWRLVWLAGEVLLSLGQERAGDSEWGQQLLGRVRQRLVALIEGGYLAPRERAEVGKVLSRLGDDRDGVGIVVGQGGVKLPAIVWSDEIPADDYWIGEGERGNARKREVEIAWPYRVARYPITQAQFACFLEATDKDDAAWWRDLPDDERQFDEPRYRYANHPRETVSWYQAVAFCRWLTAKLRAGLLPIDAWFEADLSRYEIVLPHEHEWEVAARWPPEGFEERIYPWGRDFDATKANTSEGDNVRQTTAVGLYPSGKNVALNLYDISGNVWEWCRNKYHTPEDDAVDGSGGARVLRGGSFGGNQYSARAAARNHNAAPQDRYYYVGFRLVCVRFPSHHDR